MKLNNDLLKAMTPEELNTFRNSLDPDIIGFDEVGEDCSCPLE